MRKKNRGVGRIVAGLILLSLVVFAANNLFFDEALDKNKVIVVGEIHEHESARVMIGSKLSKLADSNGALLVEHLHANRQGLLDEWLAAPADAKMPPVLKLLANSLVGQDNDPEKNKNFYGSLALIEDAKRAGVKVLGFDSDATLALNTQTIMHGKHEHLYGYPDKTESGFFADRVLIMNEAARQCVEEIQDKHDKIMVNVGAAHAVSNDAKGVLGVADYFGGMAVVIKNREPEKNEALSCGVSKRLPWWGDKKPDGEAFLMIVADPAALKHELGQQRIIGAVNRMIEKFGTPPPRPPNPNKPFDTPSMESARHREI